MGRFIKFVDEELCKHDLPDENKLSKRNWDSVWECGGCKQTFTFLPPVIKNKNGTWI